MAAVCCTGGWESPFIFSLMTAVIVAGFARGFAFALRLALVSAAAVTITYLAHGVDRRAGPALDRVEPGGHPGGRRGRLRPAHLRRGRPPALAGPRPAGPADRRQRPAVLAAPGDPDAAGLARPRRRARHDHHPPPGPVRLRLRRHPRARRHRRRLAGGPAGERAPARPAEPGRAARRRCARRWPPSNVRQRPRPVHRGRSRASAPRPAPGLYAVLAARGAVIGLLAVEHQSPRSLHQPRRRAAAGLRRAGGPGHRQRPLVRPPAHGRRRRGADPHRPRPARPHRPVPGLPGLRARPHRGQPGQGRRRRAVARAPPRRRPLA